MSEVSVSGVNLKTGAIICTQHQSYHHHTITIVCQRSVSTGQMLFLLPNQSRKRFNRNSNHSTVEKQARAIHLKDLTHPVLLISNMSYKDCYGFENDQSTKEHLQSSINALISIKTGQEV